MKRTISTNQLTPGTIFMVKGNLSFSRLISRIDGEELARDIERRKANKGIPIETPYTTATITNATVVYKDPQNPTNEERYAEESIYAGKADGRMFTGVNKGTVLPSIAMMKGTNDAYEVEPEGELAPNLPVILVMKVFAGKMNNGVGLDGVIVLSDIQYYKGGNSALADELKSRNINYHALNAAVPVAPAETQAPQAFMPAPTPAAAQNEFQPAPINPFAYNPSSDRNY